MKDSLSTILQNYSSANAIRFHMPGHSGVDIGINTNIDITELSFSDNLISATGAILDTEKLIADAYNMPYALMLTCGATSAVAIALYVASLHGDSIGIVGDAHKSVYNYADIFKLKIHKINDENMLDNLPKLAAIIITSPDYFGNTKCIEKYKGNHLIIVDQSHGAHFAFSSQLPDNQNSADILITSWHKTLPVLTGGAVISCNNNDIYSQLLIGRNILHSSSPNYMIMSSIDNCVRSMSACGNKIYNEVITKISLLTKSLPDRYTHIASDDVTRLVIATKYANGAVLSSILQTFCVYIEMSYEDKIVCIITPYNYHHLQRFFDILSQINLDKSIINCKDFLPSFDIKSTTDYNEKNAKLIDISESKNRVCMTTIGLYPPCVPIITKGEIITKEIIDFLIEKQTNIFGLITGKILAAKHIKGETNE